MYVAPQADEPVTVDEDELVRAGLLGSYRRQIGWNRESRALRAADQSFKLLGGGPGK
ncbi:hypothetical protein D3C72_2114090 [compost metagenome]